MRRAAPPRLPLRRELSSLLIFKGLTEGEITRVCCLHRGADEHIAKKRSFAFAVGYTYCFRTYSVYLSLRLPAQILYAGIHLPPQREARALPRRAQIQFTEEGSRERSPQPQCSPSSLLLAAFAPHRSPLNNLSRFFICPIMNFMSTHFVPATPARR